MSVSCPFCPGIHLIPTAMAFSSWPDIFNVFSPWRLIVSTPNRAEVWQGPPPHHSWCRETTLAPFFAHRLGNSG